MSGKKDFKIAMQQGVGSYRGMNKFPEKVLALMAASEKSKAQIARAIKVDASQFGKWLNSEGKNGPSPKQVLLLARVLKTSADYLIDDGMTESPSNEKPTEGELLILGFYEEARAQGRGPWLLGEVMDLVRKGNALSQDESKQKPHVAKPGSSGIDAVPPKEPAPIQPQKRRV